MYICGLIFVFDWNSRQQKQKKWGRPVLTAGGTKR